MPGCRKLARPDIDAILDAFAAERLIVLNEDTAQISHDVLLRAWPRLRGWLEEDQASWILHGQLADAAAAWHDGHDDPSFLYRGAQLSRTPAGRQTMVSKPAHATPPSPGPSTTSCRPANKPPPALAAAGAALSPSWRC